MRKMDDREVMGLLEKYGIPTVETVFAKDLKEAVSKAGKVGYPVALKVSSPDIVHKTEAGGLALDIRDRKELEKAYQKVVGRAKASKARVDGVLVQRMHSGGVELIVGSKVDPQFGPVIMFGLGGIFVEVLKDVVFRLIPLESGDAAEMVREIKGFRILEGVRGRGPVDFKALEACLDRVSAMVSGNPQIQELDINPLFADGKGVAAADVRVFVK